MTASDRGGGHRAVGHLRSAQLVVHQVGDVQQTHRAGQRLRLRSARARSWQRVMIGVASEHTWRIHRLRLADGKPVCVEESFIPQRLAPDLDRQDLTGSLYGLLQSRYGFRLQAAEQTIRIRTADPEEARLLESAEGGAVFVITGVIRDAEGSPVEYSHSVWRGDRYDLQVRLVSRE